VNKLLLVISATVILATITSWPQRQITIKKTITIGGEETFGTIRYQRVTIPEQLFSTKIKDSQYELTLPQGSYKVEFETNGITGHFFDYISASSHESINLPNAETFTFINIKPTGGIKDCFNIAILLTLTIHESLGMSTSYPSLGCSIGKLMSFGKYSTSNNLPVGSAAESIKNGIPIIYCEIIKESNDLYKDSDCGIILGLSTGDDNLNALIIPLGTTKLTNNSNYVQQAYTTKWVPVSRILHPRLPSYSMKYFTIYPFTGIPPNDYLVNITEQIDHTTITHRDNSKINQSFKNTLQSFHFLRDTLRIHSIHGIPVYLKKDIDNIYESTYKNLLESCSENECLPVISYIKDAYPKIPTTDDISQTLTEQRNNIISVSSQSVDKQRVYRQSVIASLLNSIDKLITKLVTVSTNMSVDIELSTDPPGQLINFLDATTNTIIREAVTNKIVHNLYRGKYLLRGDKWIYKLNLIDDEISVIRCSASSCTMQ
jgi:hypothetical protein